MHLRKYQKVSDLVGKVRVKYDEDLIRAEVESRAGPGLWSYARFYPVPTSEPISVIPLKRKALVGYRRGLDSVR
jgi:hypothetical protein